MYTGRTALGAAGGGHGHTASAHSTPAIHHQRTRAACAMPGARQPPRQACSAAWGSRGASRAQPQDKNSSSSSGGRSESSTAPARGEVSRAQRQQEPQPRVQQQLASVLAAAAVAVSSCCGVPYAAGARPLMTAEERVSIDVFKKSTPSVVNVTNLTARRDAFTMNMLEIPQGAGSGFLWDDKGHIITNYHVINDASDIQVTFMGGAEYTAKVVGTDTDKDIAVLQLGSDVDKNPPDLTTLRPLNRCSASAELMVGQKVWAIGNPFGLDHTLTTGIVSGTGREIASVSGRPIQDVIQTDAAINPGNSGGPLLDSGGCLIGINTAIYSPSGANSGVGFAIPVDVVTSSVSQIIEHGRVVRPILGISFAPDQSSEQLGVKGILVLNAREGGPAWKSGIRGTSRDDYGRLVLGDIITAINGAKVRNSSDLYRLLDKATVGDALDIEILRGDAKQHLAVVLEANT